MSRFFPEPDRSRAGGFSVLEVLVAFVIATIGLQIAIEAIGTQGRLLSEGRRERYAADWADSILTELGTDGRIIPGVSEGVLPGGYRWRLAISPVTQASDGEKVSAKLYKVELQVSWPSWIGERSLQVQTLKLLTGAAAAQP